MRQGSSTVYWLLGDHLGSTAITASGSGSKVGELRYKAWGETRYSSGTTPTSFRYTGQRLVGYIELYQMGARWYDPALSRFVSPDSIIPQPENPQSLNRYMFVLGNPLKYTDPAGHKEEGECGFNDEACPDVPPPPDIPDWLLELQSDPELLAWLMGEGYDSNESAAQAWAIVWNWFSEKGDTPLYFGPDSSLTQDVMYDRGMQAFRQAWAAAGYPQPFTYRDTADRREGGLLPVRIAKASVVFFREHLVQLPLATVGLGSRSAAGVVDPVGGTIGSLDQITVRATGNGMVQFEVYNRMDWASALRVPGMEGFLPRVERDAWGPGGALDMYFIWWEPR